MDLSLIILLLNLLNSRRAKQPKVVSFPQFKTAGISSLLTYDSVKYLVFESELGIFSYSLYPNMTLIPKYDITIVGPGKIYAAENQGNGWGELR